MKYRSPVDELVRRVADREASRTALVWREQETSYLALDSRIDQVGYGLLKLGVKAGSRIALYMHNVPQFIESYLAIMRIGAIAVPINVLHEGRDLEYLLSNCGAVGVITVAPYYPRIRQVRDPLVRLKWVVAISGSAPQPPDTIPWDSLISESLPGRMDSFAEPENTALIAYTSGASAPPRGVMHNHMSLLANIQQFQSMTQVEFGGEYIDVVLLPIPLFSLYGLNIGLNHALFNGNMVVLMERFDPAKALEFIQKYHVTIIHGTPSIYRDLLNTPEISQADLTSLRYAFCYGAPLPDPLFRAFLKRTKLPIFECYGLTEAGPVVTSTASTPQFRPGSIGQPIPGVRVRLVDSGEQDVPPGSIGEIMVSGENMMQDYFNLRKFEARQAESYETGAEPRPAPLLWMRTGDMGWLDPDYNLHVIDRRDDFLFIDGEMIFPREIEDALVTHPAVGEAAVVGVRSPNVEPHFEAVVVLDQYNRGISEAQLVEYLKGILPSRHLPQRIFFADYLPRLVNGRIMRRAIRLGSQLGV